MRRREKLAVLVLVAATLPPLSLAGAVLGGLVLPGLWAWCCLTPRERET